MKNKRRSAVVLALIAAIMLTALSYMTQPALAAESAKDRILKKSYIHGIRECFNGLTNGNKLRTANDNSVGKNETQIDQDINKGSADAPGYQAIFPAVNAANKIGLPNGWAPKDPNKNSQLNCAQLAHGGTGDASIYGTFGKYAPTKNEKDNNKIVDFYQAIGYTSNGTSMGAYITLNLGFQVYQHNDDSSGLIATGETRALTAGGFTVSTRKENGKTMINSASGNMFDSPEQAEGICPDKYDVCFVQDSTNDDGTSVKLMLSSKYGNNEFGADGYGNNNTKVYSTYESALDDFIKEITIDLKGDKARGKEPFLCYKNIDCWNFYGSSDSDPGYGGTVTLNGGDPVTVKEDVRSKATFEATIVPGHAAADAIQKYLTGKNEEKDRYLTQSERVFTYQHYLKDLGGAKVNCSATEAPAGFMPVKWFQTVDKREDCFISIDAGIDLKFNQIMPVITNPLEYFHVTTTQIGLSGIVDALNNTSISKLSGITNADLSGMEGNDDTPAGTAGGDTSIDGQDPEAAEPDCYSQAGSLGWIMCPIIEAGKNGVKWLYSFVENFLQINTNLFRAPDDNSYGANGTYIAWNTFRDIANIAFVILFLVVIFSQVTGVGIDNYGIKKILPKLVISAILINLSYLICQLAVDVANIIGGSLGDFFESIRNQIDANVAIQLPGETASGAKKVAGTAIVVTVVLAIGAAAVLASNGSALVAILAVILAVGISILSLLIILAVRQALAVFLVVFSPLAFLCYMLPNTKKIFDTWLKAFQGMLLAYPICSVFIYGGEMVAAILLRANAGPDGTVTNFVLVFSAAIVSIAPIFLIPGIIRKSMGRISGAITNLGNRASHGANRAFRGSNFASDMNRRSNAWKSGVHIDKDGNVRYNALGRMQNRLPRGNSSRRRLESRRGAVVRDYVDGRSLSGDNAENLRNYQNTVNAGEAAMKRKNVSGYEDSIRAGKLTDNNGKQIDPSDIGSLRSGLEQALLDNDETAIKAYQNVLTAKGEDGRGAVADAINNTHNKITDDARKAFSQNLVDNHGADYKNNLRSLFNYANAHQSGAKGEPPAHYANVGVGSYKPSQLGTMDDAEFNRLRARAGSMSEDEQRILSDSVHKALTSPGNENIKGERADALRELQKSLPAPNIDSPATPDSSGSPTPSADSGAPAPEPARAHPNEAGGLPPDKLPDVSTDGSSDRGMEYYQQIQDSDAGLKLESDSGSSLTLAQDRGMEYYQQIQDSDAAPKPKSDSGSGGLSLKHDDSERSSGLSLKHDD